MVADRVFGFDRGIFRKVATGRFHGDGAVEGCCEFVRDHQINQRVEMHIRTLGFRGLLVTGFILTLVMQTGCSERGSRKPKIRKKEGIAKKVDIDNRIVSMVIRDKTGNELEVPGTFRDDTSVIINGRAQSIGDIREGDKVVVEGYREGDGLNQKWIATKVTVDRPEEKDWKIAGPKREVNPPAAGSNTEAAPTTQPADD